MKIKINNEKIIKPREIQKEIRNLIPSKDVAEYLKNNKHEFKTLEMLFIIGRSNKSQSEKFEWFKRIMQNFPDEPITYYFFEHMYSHLKDREDMCSCCRAKWFYHNKFYEEAKNDEIADNVMEENKKIELNITPFYDKVRWWEFLKKWNLMPDITEKQKAMFNEKLDKSFKNPIISHIDMITKEDFEMMTIGSHSLFGMITFYMNNCERFFDAVNYPLFPLNSLPLPFKPGDCVQLCGGHVDGSVGVIINDDNDKFNIVIVNTDGSMEGAVEIDFYGIEYVPDGTHSEAVKVLRELVKGSQNDLISIENVVEALNKNRDYTIELIRNKNIIIE